MFSFFHFNREEAILPESYVDDLDALQILTVTVSNDHNYFTRSSLMPGDKR